jgi:predicted metal-dependent peptidase
MSSTSTIVNAMLTPAQKLAAARYWAKQKFPYFAPALLALVPHETDKVPTMGATDSFILLWNPKFVATLTHEECAAVLIHEAMHPLRSHAKRIAAFAPGDHYGGNVACDAEINDDLRAMGLKLPGDAIYPEAFGMPEGKLAEQYYSAIKAKQTAQGGGGTGPGGNGGSGSSDDRGSVAAGRCGTCAGHGYGLPEEMPDAGVGGRTEQEIAGVQRAVATAVRAHAEQKGRGSVPGGLDRWASTVLTPPKVRWQDKLARITRRAVAYKAGAMDRRFSRVARKQAGVGFGPGRPVLPALVSPIPAVTVAIDTSASMSGKDLDAAMREVAGVLAVLQTEVRFIACDAVVHTDKQARDWRDIARNMTGGGGTSFVPIFEACVRKRPRTELLIIATDGDGYAPPAPPPGLLVIWLLIGRHAQCPVGYGDVVHVED